MSVKNRELQATHQILSLLEQSKEKADSTLDGLPCVFAVIRSDGRILKGNDCVASLLGCDKESVIHKNFSTLFRSESWELFQMELQSLLLSGTETAEFELAVDGINPEVSAIGSHKSHYWHISRFRVQESGAARAYFTVTANDISELRKKERQLSGIFASIPLGMFSVDAEGRVSAEYSTHLEWLVGKTEIVGKDFEQLLLARGRAELDESQRSALLSLRACLGAPESKFADVRSRLPVEIRYPAEDARGDKFIGFSYQPIIYSGRVEGVFLIAEDRTALVRARLEREKTKLFEEAHLTRILELKNVAPEILSPMMKELAAMIEKLPEFRRSGHPDELLRQVSNVRTAVEVPGLTRLLDLIHGVEMLLKLELEGHSDTTPAKTDAYLSNLLNEWREYKSLHGALRASGASSETNRTGGDSTAAMIRSLFERYSRLVSEGDSTESTLVAERITMALDSFNYSPVSELRDAIEAEVQVHALAGNKKVQIEYDWDGVRVDELTKTALCDTLLVLVRNAVVHGLETPADRAARMKSEVGTIIIRVKSEFGTIHGEVDDDGRGIDGEKLLRQAVHKQQIKYSDAMNCRPEVLMNFVLNGGLWEHPERQGEARKPGLQIAQETLKKHNGTIQVRPLRTFIGTRFQFRMEMLRKSKVWKSCIALEDFYWMLSESLSHLSETIGGRINFSARGSKSGIFAADYQRVLLSITTSIAPFAHASEVDFQLSLVQGGLFECQIVNRGPAPMKPGSVLPPEFALTSSLCEDYILQHGGVVYRDNNVIRLRCGHVLESEILPNIVVGFDGTIMDFERQTILDSLSAVGQGLGIKIVNIFDGETLPPERILKVVVTRSDSGGGVGRALQVTPQTPVKTVQKELLSLVEEYLGYRKNA